MKLPGINIQFPISSLILSEEKTVETRTYPLPDKYILKPLLLIETPGKTGDFKARIVAEIVFGKSFRYSSEAEFYEDIERHQVARNSIYAWKNKPKWGWPIEKLFVFKKSVLAPRKRGIVFTTSISYSTTIKL